MHTATSAVYWLLCEGFIFLTFITTCFALIQRRFCLKATVLRFFGILLGSVGINAFLLLTHHSFMQVLGLLPLTGYLPIIFCLHLLSKSGFFQTAAVWSTGLIGYYLLKFAMKWLQLLTQQLFWAVSMTIALTGIIILSVVFLFLLFRYIKKPFQKYSADIKTNWSFFWLPLLLLLTLFSYFSNSVTDPVVFLLLFLTTFAVFLVLAKVLHSSYENFRLHEIERNLTFQMKLQQSVYEIIRKKFEMGRTYRHDMRHHLTTLNGLLQQANTKAALDYIAALGDQIGQVEQAFYCENSAVNAVLSSYIEQAKKNGCSVSVSAYIPAEMPFEDMELCVIFSNALENAVHACKKIYDVSKRNLSVNASFTEGKMAISIKNSCMDQLAFDGDGFPIVPKYDGHGIGLRSIEAIVKKYHGFFSCSLASCTFLMQAVIFEPRNQLSGQKAVTKHSAKKVAVTTCSLLLSLCLFANAAPVAGQKLSDTPVRGNVISVVTLKSHYFRWGDLQLKMTQPIIEQIGGAEVGTIQAFCQDERTTGITTSADTGQETTASSQQKGAHPILKHARPNHPKAEINIASPVVVTSPAEDLSDTKEPQNPTEPDLSEGIEDINKQMEKYVEQLRKEFWRYVSIKYQGYVGMDCMHNVLFDNKDILSIRFDTVINVGGSVMCSRIFSLDKRSGEVLLLKNLFLEDSDYINTISREILRQMKQQVDAGTADYFIPGGIWSEKDCFKMIEADQNFYINEQQQLVLVFDEYTVAPGSMGCPEFVISSEVIAALLVQPSLLQ